MQILLTFLLVFGVILLFIFLPLFIGASLNFPTYKGKADSWADGMSFILMAIMIFFIIFCVCTTIFGLIKYLYHLAEQIIT